MFRVNRTTVLGHVRRHGIPKRDRRALRGDDVDRAKKLYAEGRSADWIAGELGAAASTVRRALQDTGAALRTPGRQQWGQRTEATGRDHVDGHPKQGLQILTETYLVEERCLRSIRTTVRA